MNRVADSSANRLGIQMVRTSYENQYSGSAAPLKSGNLPLLRVQPNQWCHLKAKIEIALMKPRSAQEEQEDIELRDFSSSDDDSSNNSHR